MRTPEQKLATKVNPPVTARLGCSCLNQATTLTIRSGPVWVLAESRANRIVENRQVVAELE